jgi:uncharacterized protein
VTVQLDHEFIVPAPAAQAWPVLLDIERIGPCLPGATITKVEGDTFEGKVKVKVGPITVTYTGTASFLEKDEAARRVVIEARGKETRGTGTANASITAQLHDQGDSTRVTVSTDLSVTGKPAQFGRGVMSDVGAKLLGQFADCLADRLAGKPEPAAAAAQTDAALGQTPAEAAGTAPAAGSAPAAVLEAPASPPPPRPTSDEIDLIGTAGIPVLKRAAPVLAAIAVIALLLIVIRRRLR